MSNIAAVWLTSSTLQHRLCSLHTASPNIMTQHLQKTLWWLPMMASNVMRWVWFVQLQSRWIIYNNCWSGPQLCQTQELSSAQCKELFRHVQLCSDDGHVPRNPPLQLMLDMKVRWSSLFVMLRCALDLMEASHFSSSNFYHLTSIFWQEIIYFIRMLGIQEWDPEKHHKIQDLKLTEEEWLHVHLLLSLLAVSSIMLLNNHLIPNHQFHPSKQRRHSMLSQLIKGLCFMPHYQHWRHYTRHGQRGKWQPNTATFTMDLLLA